MRRIALGLFAVMLAAAPATGRAADAVKRGEYLARNMDCTGCHTAGALAGQPDPARHLAGSTIGFRLPGLGTFYPPNLTPDAETGLGKWSAAEIATALRTGVRPDGRELAPAMPWRSYAALTDADLESLVAYLKSLPPVRHAAPPAAGEGEHPPAPYLTVVVPE
jgi:mono/diheme cytochrome c family protein